MTHHLLDFELNLELYILQSVNHMPNEVEDWGRGES